MKMLITAAFLYLWSIGIEANSRRQYDLFSPTPASEMRGLTTDRPDKTESPYTVDAGHFQLETDVVNYTRDKDRATATTTTLLNVNNMNLKLGLTDDSDLQMVFATYVEQRSESLDSKSSNKGFGDTYLRYKYNFFGNNGGPASLGIMPYVKIPTAGAGISNRRTEGGLIIPMGVKLPDEWNLGLMVQTERLRKGEDTGWQTDYILSTTVSHGIAGNLSGFMEVYSRGSDNADQGMIMTFDVGLIYALTERVQLDTGAFFGITPAADDLNTFLGVSVLF